MEMAVKEGWYQKNGSKWQSMPEQMLRYRAASFFGRIYAPDLLMGLKTQEEEQDAMIDVTPEPSPQAAPVTMESIKQNVVKEVTTEPAVETKQVEQVKEAEKPKRARTQPKVVEEDDGKYQTLLADLIERSKQAKNENEVGALVKHTNAWSAEQRAPLHDAMSKRIAELKANNSASTQETTAADPIKSNMAKEGLKNQIANAPSVEALKEIAETVRDYKLKLTNDDMGEVLADYSARKKLLEDQQDMFADVVEVSYVDAVIKRIQNAKSQDDINAEFDDPAYEELSGADQERINKEAQQREAELQD